MANVKIVKPVLDKFAATLRTEEPKTVLDHRATVVSTNPVTVLIDGGTDPTPAVCEMSCKKGDRVTCRIVDHTCRVTGNVTSPATDDTRAEEAIAAIEALEESEGEELSALKQSLTQLIQTAQQSANQAAAAASATRQHFWHDGSGAHVDTSLGNENILINAVGILLRTSASVDVSITRGAVTFYDSTGAIMATYSKDGLMLGKESDNHVMITSEGIALQNGDTDIGWFSTKGIAFVSGDTSVNISSKEISFMSNVPSRGYMSLATMGIESKDYGYVDDDEDLEEFTFEDMGYVSADCFESNLLEGAGPVTIRSSEGLSMMSLGAQKSPSEIILDAKSVKLCRDSNCRLVGNVYGSKAIRAGLNSNWCVGMAGSDKYGSVYFRPSKTHMSNDTSYWIHGNASEMQTNTKWTTQSDRRLKKHESYIVDASRFIEALKPAVYEKNGCRSAGFYAQDVEAADPWDVLVSVSEDERFEDGVRSLDYSGLIAPLVAYCQRLGERVGELERKVSELEDARQG